MISLWHIIFGLCLVLYYFYCKKFNPYIWLQKSVIKETKNFRGKSLPCFPNGWFKVLNSNELRRNEVKYIDYCGRNIAVFRGTDDKVYALDAYCPHMGANIALGGEIKFDRGIQCPFHGWIYDGATGNCVSNSSMEPRKGEVFAYNNLDSVEKKNGSVLVKECNKTIQVKKYIVREIADQILLWYHSDDSLREKPLYEPLTFKHNLVFRGESINFINCQIQDIPENGADLKHFYYVHTYIIKWLKFVQFRWRLRWTTADDPNLYEYMKLDNPSWNSYRRELLEKTITPENKKYLSVLGLDNKLAIFGYEFNFFALTGFQLGPGLVYLFLKSNLFEAWLQQAVTPIEKYMQKVTHRISTNKGLPYIISASMLWGEVQQLLADQRIWNNKQYTPKLTYDLTSQADQYMYKWRTWYGQFYEGCREYEKTISQYEW